MEVQPCDQVLVLELVGSGAEGESGTAVGDQSPEGSCDPPELLIHLLLSEL